MKNLNRIVLDTNNSKELAELLNDLLANYSIFYQNTRGFHWNIKGYKFFELHLKFEELYNNLFLKIDELAERILTLGHSPRQKFTEYLRASSINESNEVTDGPKAIKVMTSYKTFMAKQRHILKLSADINDEGTNALMSDYMREQENSYRCILPTWTNKLQY